MRLHPTVLETWLETCLIPALQPGQVVIMDNATFHKGGRIQELIESAGCRLLYLPPTCGPGPLFPRFEPN